MAYMHRLGEYARIAKELKRRGALPPICAACKKPIDGPPSTVHTPGKPDELYHPNHLQYRER